MAHLTYALLASLVVAGALALGGSRSAMERAYHAAYVFVCCTGAVIAGGWLMFLVHG